MELQKLIFCWCFCSLSVVYQVDARIVELVAEFNTQRVNGIVSFSLTGDGNVKISVEELLGLQSGSLSIHNFPVKYEGLLNEMCKIENIGGIFDPANVQRHKNYSTSCSSNSSNCAIGDLSNRFNHLFSVKVVNDSKVSLSGKWGIFGRSLVIHDNETTIVACATIKSRASTKTVVGVFRAVSLGIAGTIVLRQTADEPHSDTSVDINLMLVDARSEPMTGLSLAVYKGVSTSDTDGSCEGLKELFNPFGKTSCDKRKQSTCPIGDLSAKLAQLDIPLPGKGTQHNFYIDTNLPLSGENSVVGNSLVISSGGTLLICSKIQEYQEMLAAVMMDYDKSLHGTIEFTQGSLYEPVVVNVTLNGRYDKINVYEHMSDGSSCIIDESGDQLAMIEGPGQMDEITMYGPKAIMFRSLIIKGSKLYCKKIQPKNPTYHLKAQVNLNETTSDGLGGFVEFEQVLFNKSKAFSFSSSILMSVKYKNNKSKITLGHNWHVHISGIGNDSKLAVGKKCMSAKGHYNPYGVYEPNNDYASTCNPSNPFRCELGDLSSKLGQYDIGGGLKQFTETENYLASWHNVLGRSVVIHTENKGAGRLACANILPLGSQVYNWETLIVKSTLKTKNKESFQKVVSEALNIDSWRVADVKYDELETDKNCLTYTFVLIDDSTSDLHQAFADLVDGNSGKLKEFAPACGDETGWKINEGNASEILGVVFGIIILIILVICFVFWMKKRRQEHEEASKLVESEDAEAAAADQNESVEKNDNPEAPPDPKMDPEVTTSL